MRAGPPALPPVSPGRGDGGARPRGLRGLCVFGDFPVFQPLLFAETQRMDGLWDGELLRKPFRRLCGGAGAELCPGTAARQRLELCQGWGWSSGKGFSFPPRGCWALNSPGEFPLPRLQELPGMLRVGFWGAPCRDGRIPVGSSHFRTFIQRWFLVFPGAFGFGAV